MAEDNFYDKINEVKHCLKNLENDIIQIDKDITKMKKERIKKRKEETELKRILTQLCAYKKGRKTNGKL